MCRAVTCAVCGKTTWTGCGQHVNQVRRTVPAGQWCSGHPAATTAREATGTRAGVLSRLFGR